MYIRKHISCFVVTCVAQDISKCGSDVGGVLSSGLSREYTSLDRSTLNLHEVEVTGIPAAAFENIMFFSTKCWYFFSIAFPKLGKLHIISR